MPIGAGLFLDRTEPVPARTAGNPPPRQGLDFRLWCASEQHLLGTTPPLRDTTT